MLANASFKRMRFVKNRLKEMPDIFVAIIEDFM